VRRNCETSPSCTRAHANEPRARSARSGLALVAATLTWLPAISGADRWNLRDIMRANWRGGAWLVLGIMAFATVVAARAQNLDEGKSGQRLFADSCAACHRSPRGLTKGRFQLTLYLYLQKHYASNSTSAWELASYLESVDEAPRGAKGKSRAAKHAASTAPRSGSSLRPPAPIPQR